MIMGARPSLLLASLLAVLLPGCASVVRSPADQLVDRGDYEAAIVAYQAEEARSPADPRIKRNQGIALFLSGRRSEAAAKLQESRALEPGDPRTLYFLGRAAEETGQLDLALASYADYLGVTEEDAKAVRAKVQELSVRRATREVLSRLERERELDVRAVPENTLAVPEFENALGAADLESLRYGLAAVLITDLSQVEAIRVLERERLGVLLDEIDLAAPSAEPAATEYAPIGTVQGMQQRLAVLLRPGTGTAYYAGPADGTSRPAYQEAVRLFQADRGLTVDGIPGPRTREALEEAMAESGAIESPRRAERPRSAVSAETAPRLGKILGARRFVQGSFAPVGDERIQLGASLLEVAEGRLRPAGEPVVGPLSRVLRLEKDLVYQILETLGIEPGTDERKRIDALPTDSFLAFLAYSRGLYLEEQGRLQEAAEAYGEALRADPGFRAAEERQEITTATAEDGVELERTELQGALGPTGEVLTTDRILRTATWGGIGPGPDVDRSGDADPTVQDVDKITPADAILVIEGEVPGAGGRP